LSVRLAHSPISCTFPTTAGELARDSLPYRTHWKQIRPQLLDKHIG
jgi:CDP-diacylglycerol pyrophosphatase